MSTHKGLLLSRCVLAVCFVVFCAGAFGTTEPLMRERRRPLPEGLQEQLQRGRGPGLPGVTKGPVDTGVWVLHVQDAMANVGAATYAEFADMVSELLEPDWIAIKAAQGICYCGPDPSYPEPEPESFNCNFEEMSGCQLKKELADALHKAKPKMKVFAWHYIGGTNLDNEDISEQEGELGNRLLNQRFIDGLIVVPQSWFYVHEEGATSTSVKVDDQRARARNYLRQITKPPRKLIAYVRPLAPGEKLPLASGYAEFTDAFDGHPKVDVVMPTVYWHQTAEKYGTLNNISARVRVRMEKLREQYADLSKVKKVWPVGQATTSESIHLVPYTDHDFINQFFKKIVEFNASPTSKLKIPGCSLWSVDCFKTVDYPQVGLRGGYQVPPPDTTSTSTISKMSPYEISLMEWDTLCMPAP